MNNKLTDLTTSHFIAGYKHHPDHEEIHWLCNHPEALDLIFSKDKHKAFVFDNEHIALNAINDILLAENRPWFTPVVENLPASPPVSAGETPQTPLQQIEANIHDYLKLFNERNHGRLKLFLTLNRQDNSIRGYGTGVKLGDAVINFVALLTVKGMKARCLDEHTFIVRID